MARTTPSIRNASLELPTCNGNRSASIPLDSADWQQWLEHNRAFRFESHEGSFTARREQRPGGWYWYAYRRLHGMLHIAYLGRSRELTADRLASVAAQLASSASETRQAAPGGINAELLFTRLTVPQPRANLLPRPHLVERLEQAWQYTLTLLSAPAGSGKTTLLSAWCRQSSLPNAWLTLDEGNNDPASFWTYVCAALSTFIKIPPRASALLRESQPAALTSALVILSNTLRTLTQESILVLDDYHLIQSTEIHRTLARFLESLPPQMHLLLASRADPPLSLPSLRAAGKLLEIRGDDLRFTPAEVRVFLRGQPELALTEETITLLETRTEGWIAGLQLAALSLRDRGDSAEFVRTFSGQDRYILDYLMEEVLARQPCHIQDFLLQTSILQSLSAALCDTVREQENSQEMLETLERSNLFVSALDHQRHWYRYHQLFAQALRHRLRQDNPALFARLHQRAASWYEARGMASEAIEHALTSGADDYAARLIERLGEPILLRGESRTVLNWLHALPAQMRRARPLLSCLYAFALLVQSRFEAVEEYLRDAERTLADLPPDLYTMAEQRRLQGMLYAARSTVAANLDYAESAIAYGLQALDHLEEHDLAQRAIAFHSLGDAYEMQGNMLEAENAFKEALAIHRKTGNIFIALITIGSLGGIQATRGQLHQAEITYRQALALASTQTFRNQETALLPPAGKTLVLLSELLYEWNRLEEAEEAARHGIQLCQQWHHLWHTIQGHMSLATILFARERPGEAFHTLDQAQHILTQAQMASEQYTQTLLNQRLLNLAASLAECRISLLIASGELVSAELHIAALPAPLEKSSFTRSLLQSALLFARGEFATAARQIADLLRDAETNDWRRAHIDLLTRQALALNAQDKVQPAQLSLAQALRQAEPEQYMRAFLNRGVSLAPLLRQAIAQQVAPAYAHKLLTALSFQPHREVSAEIDALNEREESILRLLAEGLSNQAIAERLMLATGTVKWYVHHIYAKLGVHSRTQAISEARKRQLLD